MKTHLRSLFSKAAIAVFGRRLVVRGARAFAMEARLDVSNDMAHNGELLVQRTAIRFASEHSAPGGATVVDAGANVGDWSSAFVTASDDASVDTKCFAFEPASQTFQILTRNLASIRGRAVIKAVNKALSDRSGHALLNIVGAGAGTNSLHVQTDIPVAHTETIECTTLDTFCADEGIDHILLLKIDTEGHEMSVLRGGHHLLERGAIELVQFEYNHRWIASRHYLRDAFELLLPLGYHIGKITPKGIEFYEEWHYELESWNEGNYLACRPQWTTRFARVPWWNE